MSAGSTSGSARCLACHGELARAPALVAPDRMHGVAGTWAVHRCLSCGSGTTLPLATADELETFYPTDYAPFDPPRGPLAAAMRAMQRARNRRFPLRTIASRRPSGTLVDVGCGRGDLVESWVQRGWRAVGIEPSADAAAVAAARGAEVVIGTLESAQLAPASADAVVFRHSLEHVLDPRGDLGLARRALRPGGVLAIIVPNWGSWQRRAFGEYWFPLELPRHRTHFTAPGLRAAIGAGGFDKIDVRPATPLITATWSLQFARFGRLLTDEGPRLLAGYAASVPVAVAARAADAVLGGGDFLHASARVPGS